MKTHTSSFKEQIKLIGKEIDSRITFGSTVLGKNDLNAVTPSYQGAILKSVMKQLDIDSNVAIPIGTILKYEFGLKVNGEYEYINYGNYVVYSVEKQEDMNSYKITCYDKLLYSMLDYVKLPITYPISIRDYINAISTTLGLKFANKSGTFANYNKQIQADLYDGLGYTFRDVLDELAQVTASTICLNNNDELEIRYITETGDTIDEEFLKDVNVNFGEKFGAVNTIVLSRSAGSDNIYYPTVLPTNPYEIKISDNQIMNGNDRADFLPDIYNKLNGLEFYTNDFVSTGIIYYDLCDRYSVKVGDNTYSCVMFNDEVLVTQGLEENIYTELPEQTKTDYKKADTTDRRINQAYILVDKQNQRIDAVVSNVNTNAEKVASLEITTGNISTKVSSVEKNLSTTNTNLSNLSNTVDTLSNDINGVSADFEDFKDNEYIQSIDNLQKQIDGAIQFWNGAEIPTLNNYPANEWTTENDRINHQADIYTVVQDVEGEMKQGKSYRFDKIDGVWQWIELTDNELSAVQAIAQEALDKANANATEIGTVKTRVSSLEQTDEQIKASVESIDKQIIPTATVTGSNIYIEDASDDPLIQLEIEGKSEQETSTQGKNSFNINGNINNTEGNWQTFGVNTLSNGIITTTATSNSRGIGQKINIPVGTTVTFSAYVESMGTGTAGAINIIQAKNNEYYTQNYISGKPDNRISVTATIQEGVTEVYFTFLTWQNSTNDASGAQFSKPQVEIGNTATDYEEFIPDSPSPDYPSEIESVGYENLFKPALVADDGRTIQIANGTVKLNDDVYSFTATGTDLYFGQINGEGKAYDGTRGNLIDVSNFDSISYSLSNDLFAKNFITYYDENLISLGYSQHSNAKHKINLSNAPTGTKYITFRFGYGSATVGETYETTVQIKKGNIVHSHIPYGKSGIEVKKTGHNLFDKNNRIVKGSYINDSGGLTVDSNLFYQDVYIKVKPNTNYTISSANVSVYRIAEYNTNKMFLKRLYNQNASTSYTIITSSTTEYIKLSCNISDLDTIQFAVGTDVKPYDSPQTLLIVLNDLLRSLPNGVKDIAYIKNNKLYVDRYVRSVVLDGVNYNFASKSGTTANNMFVTNVAFTDIKNVSNNSELGSIMSNYFENKITNLLYSSDLIGIGARTNNALTVAFGLDSEINTIELANAWLSENKPQVDYELAEPYTEDLGEINMPRTFKNVNHITTSDELEPTLSIEYVRDTTLSNYVEGQINKVMTIEERHYSELVIEDDNIKASVESVNSSLNGLNTTINRVEEITTDNSQVINVISTNIDRTSGEVREVTTTTGFTFNSDGMTIDDRSGFKAQHRSDGTYYKDGESIVGQYTKDGSKQKDLELFGTYSYGKESINDTPMFVGQLYTDENGEQGFGHFYNGEG